MTTSIFAAAAMATFGLQTAGFVVAAMLQTEVFYDILGGLNFLLLPWLFYPSENDVDNKTTSVTNWFCLCQVVSRGWLLVFLGWRAHSRKGDSRFDGVKDNPPLFLVYWMVQACWIYLISLPLLVIYDNQNGDNESFSLTTLNTILLIGFAASILLEITSDIQKTLWVERGRPGTFCRDGWWAYSRHPNYAGEVLQWWFAAALAVVAGGSSSHWSLLALASPLFTMHILLNTSGTGIWHAEGKNLKRYYDSKENGKDYEHYRSTTSPLLPMVAYGRLPLWVKRWFLFEWERFQYRPQQKNKDA
mmetsp:Transcript_8852/g.14728  ORF Transcript_8852/g.14728 Transcript_8852/m.14728 type:complete len:303 (+) Transcript_8852:41-949(+)